MAHDPFDDEERIIDRLRQQRDEASGLGTPGCLDGPDMESLTKPIDKSSPLISRVADTTGTGEGADTPSTEAQVDGSDFLVWQRQARRIDDGPVQPTTDAPDAQETVELVPHTITDTDTDAVDVAETDEDAATEAAAMGKSGTEIAVEDLSAIDRTLDPDEHLGAKESTGTKEHTDEWSTAVLTGEESGADLLRDDIAPVAPGVDADASSSETGSAWFLPEVEDEVVVGLQADHEDEIDILNIQWSSEAPSAVLPATDDHEIEPDVAGDELLDG